MLESFFGRPIIYGEKIGFIGLGKLGMPCAEAIRKKGFHVAGYDIADRRSELVEIRDSIEDLCRDRDIVFVATPTPHEQGYDGTRPTSHMDPADFNYESLKKIFPDDTFSRPPINMIKLVLPEPLSPTTEIVSLLSASKLIFFKIFIDLLSIV